MLSSLLEYEENKENKENEENKENKENEENKENKENEEPVINSVLNLPMCARRDLQQHIYGLPMLGDQDLYMIEMSEESKWLEEGKNDFVLECT